MKIRKKIAVIVSRVFPAGRSFKINNRSLFCMLMILSSLSVFGQKVDSLPTVFDEYHGNFVEKSLRQEAIRLSSLYHLPHTTAGWNQYKSALKKKILKKTGAIIDQNLPLNIKETGSLQLQGYTIKNIAFQTRPGVYTTANLYIPDGRGKFPAVIVMMGHSAEGRLYDKYQEVGITLALNGYVNLCIDPWGSGERTTVHGVFEDHGDQNNLGSALLNIGEPLMGLQITDNIRGVDLLCSLPYVDADRIGATGASGGGNQTMWLTAIDERIRAAVPVVSVGTFESYVMGSPCICEVLTDGLSFTEEAGILSLIAPRALKMCNHSRDDLAAFRPREMLRSYKKAKPVFEMMDAGRKIAYDTFNLIHGYWPEDRQAMLGWFNFQLKGTGDGSPVTEIPFNTLPIEQLMVFKKGERDAGVISTAEYCRQKGNDLRKAYLTSHKFNAASKRNELGTLLRINQWPVVKKVTHYQEKDGWKRIALETSDNKLIPVLLQLPSNGSNEFVIVCQPSDKKNISSALFSDLKKAGTGIVIVDLSGTGETSSASLNSNENIGRLRTYFKSCLLLGRTPIGEWVKELDLVAHFIKSEYGSARINFYGYKEAGLAGLFLATRKKVFENISLENTPLSYVFDNRDSIEYFSSCINLPGFLQWGDVSLASTLTGKRSTI